MRSRLPRPIEIPRFAGNRNGHPRSVLVDPASTPVRTLWRGESETRSRRTGVFSGVFDVQRTGIVFGELDRLAEGSTHRNEPRDEPMTAADTLERGREA